MTQDAFDWLDLTFRRGRPTLETKSLPNVPAREPYSRAPRIDLVRVSDPLQARYPAKLGAANGARPTRQIPLANLLQPTSCHVHPARHPASRLEGSHLLCRHASAAHPAGWVSRLPRSSSTAAPASHCWRHQPWMANRMVSHRPTEAESPPHDGMPGVPSNSPGSLVGLTGAG